MIKWLWIIIILISFSGCRIIKKDTQEKEKIVIKYIDRQQEKDSIFIYKHDSILITTKGDTVFVEKFHTLYKDRLYIKNDTIRFDSIIFKENKVIIEKGVSKMSIFWQQLGKILFVVLLLYLLYKFWIKK